MSKSDFDRLREILPQEPLEQPDYRSKRERENAVQQELTQLAISLHKHKFIAASQAIASYLLGYSTSLDQAFGLKRPGRGRPPNQKTAVKYADALEMHFNKIDAAAIAATLNLLEVDVERFCQTADRWLAELRGESPAPHTIQEGSPETSPANNGNKFDNLFVSAFGVLVSRKIAQN